VVNIIFGAISFYFKGFLGCLELFLAFYFFYLTDFFSGLVLLKSAKIKSMSNFSSFGGLIFSYYGNLIYKKKDHYVYSFYLRA